MNQFSDVFLSTNLDECLTTHDNTVRQEKDRKEGARRAIEEGQREKLEDKRRKKEAKEAAKKAAELKKLKDDVYAVYISRGDFKDSILSNEVSEANGHHTKQPCTGVLGGFIG